MNTLIGTLPLLALLAWFLALVAFMVGAYTLALNVYSRTNRTVFILLLLSTLNFFGIGLLLRAVNVSAAQGATYLLSAIAPAIPLVLLTLVLIILAPDWLAGRRRWFSWILGASIGLTPVLTLVDMIFGTGLWYTGLSPATYLGGFAPLSDYINGLLAPYLLVLLTQGVPLLIVLGLLFWLWRSRSLSRAQRTLVIALLMTHISAWAIELGLRNILLAGVAELLMGVLLAFSYGYVGLRSVLLARTRFRGQLQIRLTLIVLAAVIPLFAGGLLLSGELASELLIASAIQRLEVSNQALGQGIMLWLELNYNILTQLAARPDIVSMDPALQKVELEAFVLAYPYYYLASTTDLLGFNIARNDRTAPVDYSDRTWFRTARGGQQALQVVEGRTGLDPALVLAMPIRDELGQILGTAMGATRVTYLSQQVRVPIVGKTGRFFVVNESNAVVLHSQAETFTEVQDFTNYPPVIHLRRGNSGAYNFVDEDGVAWESSVSKLTNGWGVVMQVQRAELLQDFQLVQRAALVLLLGGILLLSALTFFSLRQSFGPVRQLTEAATAIAAGEIARNVEVESEDELATLARAFNAMTQKQRELIDSLETQVQERTQDLARRAAYLEAAAEVSRATTSLLEQETLLQQAAQLIQEHFDLYYVGLFVTDAAGEWAVLRAATGEAGRRMLARGHRLRIGPGSMIGWCVQNAQARVAQEAGADAVRLASVELPDTRSEAAIPVRSRGRVLGAISVQHTAVGAFDEDAIAALQVMADQLGAALDNATLLAESRESLEAAQRAFGEARSLAWQKLLAANQEWGYRYGRTGIVPATGEWQPEMRSAAAQRQSVAGHDAGAALLAVPLSIRDEVIGVLHFRRSGAFSWSTEERATLETLTAQLGEALEGARLYQDAQQRAARERLVSDVMLRVRGTLDLETVLKLAAQEMRQAFDLPELTVQLTLPTDATPAHADPGTAGTQESEEGV